MDSLSQNTWRQTSHVKISHHQFHNSEAKVDLTLRLGLPINGGNPQDYSHKVGMAPGFGNGGSEPNYNPNQILWSKELKTYVLKSNPFSFGQLQSSFHYERVRGITSRANNLVKIVPLQKNEPYTLLNPSSRREDCYLRRLRRRRLSRSQLDSDKKCTNYNCNTNNTPMWRSGPLGPKSLCNACGIRYRKDKLNGEAAVADNINST